MAASSMQIKVEFDTTCIDKLLDALKLFGDISKDYPDDDRFQTVTDQIMDAMEHDGNSRGSN